MRAGGDHRASSGGMGLARSPRGGFALLEAILALAVFSIAAVALTQALGQMGLTAVESADHAWRLELVESYLEQASKAWVVREGEVQMDPGIPGHRIKVVTRPAEVRSQSSPGVLPDLFEVTVELYQVPSGGGLPRLLEKGSTYRYLHLYAQ